ncbi:MAG: GNAT family N-acetyltransferase [Gammaproteobacteria bacterium]|nr:GNAT family N-acetyltransferase [Gammaproteobacteria bacterium]
MTETIVLRPAQVEQASLLSELALRSKAHWGYSSAFMQACRVELEVSASDICDPARRYVTAEADGLVAGYYALEQLSPDECELEALFVEPRHIGRGVGRQLIEHAKSEARRWGARTLVIQGDPNAVTFYLAAGGVAVGERESDSIPGRYLPVFRIELSA